jgi:hypothetical protein
MLVGGALAPVLGGFEAPPLNPGSVEAGTARAMVGARPLAESSSQPQIDRQAALRLLGGFYALKYRQGQRGMVQ